MAHDLSIRADGTAEMAWVGDTPWHGLGQQLEVGAGMDVWAKAAGLDWNANEATVQFAIPEAPDALSSFEARKVLYRSDTQAPLSVVSNSYKTVQPSTILDFFREVTNKTDAQMETAGSLAGGKVIWALARLGKDAQVRDDIVAPYLMLSTSYDMSIPTIAKLVATRVVCRNTIQLALGEQSQRQIRIPHSTDFNAENVRAGLEISLDQFDKFMQQAARLADKRFEQSDMDKFLLTLMQPEKGEIDGDQIRKSVAYRKISDLFQGGQLGTGQDAIKSTAWGALSAVTEYIDHVKGKNQSARLMDAWYGQSGKFKERALEILSA